MLFLLPLFLIALFAVIVLALQRLDNREESIHDGPDWRDDVDPRYLTPLGKQRLGIDKRP